MSRKSNTIVTVDLLRVFPLMGGLSEDVLTQIAANSTLRQFSRRAVVLNAGQHEEFLCFLFEGRLQGVDFTVDGREVGIYFIEPRDFCGELGLVDRGVQPEYVMALSSSKVIQVPMLLLRQIIYDSPALMSALCLRMASKVRAMTRQRSLLGLPNIAQRVCGQLWMLILPSQSTIENPPTHQEIAIMLNLSRETVTRVFQQLQAQKIVKRDGSSRLLIEDIDRLIALSRGESEL